MKSTATLSAGGVSDEEWPPPDLAEGISVDEALQLRVGEFGRGQQLFYCLTQLAWFVSAMQTLVMVFTGLDPVALRWFSCDPGSSYEACNAILASDSAPWADFCKLPSGSHSWTRSTSSIISEWDLICSERYKQQAVNSAFFAGFLVGAGLFGALSDRLGMFCGFAPSYWFYFVARLVTGIGVAGVGLVAYVLGCEYVGPSWRGFLGVTAQYFFAFGTFSLTLFAYAVPSWRALCYATAGATLVYSLVVVIVPESPRWQLFMGMKEEATATLAFIAEYNRTTMPEAPLQHAADSTSAPRDGLGDIWKHKVILWRLVVQLVAWFAISSTYYGISLMVADLPGSVYVNNAVMASVEVISYAAASLLIDRLGRRWTIAGSYVLGGASLLASACTTGRASIGFAIVAKIGAAAAFAAVFIYAAELFPTSIRNVSMGIMSQAARIGGILTPSLILLGHSIGFPLFGFVVLGFLSTMAGMLLLTQPETMGEFMPETIQDIKDSSTGSHGAGQSSWASMLKRRGSPEPGRFYRMND